MFIKFQKTNLKDRNNFEFARIGKRIMLKLTKNKQVEKHGINFCVPRYRQLKGYCE